MSVNKAILLGRLGKDPELKQTTTGKSVCTFSVATDTSYGGNKETTWHNIVAWGKQAEVINEYLSKGREIYVEGRITNRSYEKDGQKKYVTEIVLESFSFVGGKQEAKEETKPVRPEDDVPF